MKLFFLCLLVVFSAMAWGKIHKEMERMIERSSFKPLRRSAPDHQHSVIIALPKLNMDRMESILEERSSPESPNYLKWMTYDEVTSLVANEQSHEAVVQWLEANNLSVQWTSRRKDYLRVHGTISQWESLLKTEFYAYLDESLPERVADLRGDPLHMDSHRVFHRSKSYSLPEEMLPHITAIFNTVQAPPKFNKKYQKKPRQGQRGTPFQTKLHLDMADTIGTDGSSTPSGSVTVSFLNSYYDISSNIALANGTLSQAVFETGSNYFSPEDLATFQSKNCLPQQEAVSVGAHDIDACPTSPPTSAPDCYEGNLDIQYIMGVSQQTVSIFWWVTDGNIASNTDPFLVWILAVADETDPPKVNSISYGVSEKFESVSVMSQFNTEAILLGVQGVTITVSSGDDGAPNDDYGSCNCAYSSSSSTLSWSATISQPWTGKGYFPSFPATSPYVTAVGATQGPESGDTEIACQSQLGGIITTGGGFSMYYAAPSWQKAAIAKYFATLTSQSITLSSGYNPNGRGYPDVSLIGVSYQVVVNGIMQSVFGTSCSSPVFAAMVSLLNSQRAVQGLQPVGFMNPTLWSYGYNSTYLNPTAYAKTSFNDVTSGNNKCCSSQVASQATCCSSGFTAVTGWDPVTGWGSVQFPNLARMFEVENLTALALNASTTIICNPSSSPSSLSTAAVIAITVVTILAVGTCIGVVVFCICCTGARQSPLARQQEPPMATAVPIQNPTAIYMTNVQPGQPVQPAAAGRR